MGYWREISNLREKGQMPCKQLGPSQSLAGEGKTACGCIESTKERMLVRASIHLLM